LSISAKRYRTYANGRKQGCENSSFDALPRNHCDSVLVPFPGIAFAVSPAPESGTENTQIVESDSTPAETSSSVQAATSDSTPAATPNNVQAAAPDNIQSTVPESTQTAAPNNIQTAAPDNAQAQSSDSAPAATSDGAPAETSDGTQAEATDKETLPLLIIVERSGRQDGEGGHGARSGNALPENPVIPRLLWR
jgi:hypothetical protein